MNNSVIMTISLFPFGVDEIRHRMVVADRFGIGYDGVETCHSGVLSFPEEFDCSAAVTAACGEDTACIVGDGCVAGFQKIALSFIVFAALKTDVGGVEVEHGVVGINADGGFKYVAVVLRSFGIALRKGVEVDVAQAGGVGGIDAPDIFERRIYLNYIADCVVGVTQPRIDLGEYNPVVFREAGLDGLVLVVVSERTVDYIDDLCAVGDVELQGVGHIAAQTSPVLGLVVRGDGGVGELVEVAYIAAEGLGTAFCESLVVAV